MKRCPACGRIYTDDLSFCLEDGTVLDTDVEDGETPTVVRPSVRPRTRWARYLLIAIIGAVALGLAGAVGAYFVFTRLDRGASPETGSIPPEPSPTRPSARTSPSPSPTEKPLQQRNVNVAPEPAAEQHDTPAEPRGTSENEPDGFVDPATERISFGRGRSSQTVSGRISRTRSFVLRTLAGQQLTATVTSEDGCVAFADGGTRTSFSTPAGDAGISLRNRCPLPVRFRLTVAVR